MPKHFTTEDIIPIENLPGDIGGGTTITDENIYYFRSDGDDTEGDGTIAHPWLTAEPMMALLDIESTFALYLDIGVGVNLGGMEFTGDGPLSLYIRGRASSSITGVIVKEAGSLSIHGNGRYSCQVSSISGGAYAVLLADILCGAVTLDGVDAVEGESPASDGGELSLVRAFCGAFNTTGGNGAADYVSGNGGSLTIDGDSRASSMTSSAGGNGGAGVGTVGVVLRKLQNGVGSGLINFPASGSLAVVDSQTFTGTPNLPSGTIATTQTAGDSTTKLATTAFVTTADNLKANIASPTFTGTPTMPTGTIGVTQTAGDSTTKLATTAFATAAAAARQAQIVDVFTNTFTANSQTLTNAFTNMIWEATVVRASWTSCSVNFTGTVVNGMRFRLSIYTSSTASTLIKVNGTTVATLTTNGHEYVEYVCANTVWQLVVTSRNGTISNAPSLAAYVQSSDDRLKHKRVRLTATLTRSFPGQDYAAATHAMVTADLGTNWGSIVDESRLKVIVVGVGEWTVAFDPDDNDSAISYNLLVGSADMPDAETTAGFIETWWNGLSNGVTCTHTGSGILEFVTDDTGESAELELETDFQGNSESIGTNEIEEIEAVIGVNDVALGGSSDPDSLNHLMIDSFSISRTEASAAWSGYGYFVLTYFDQAGEYGDPGTHYTLISIEASAINSLEGYVSWPTTPGIFVTNYSMMHRLMAGAITGFPQLAVRHVENIEDQGASPFNHDDDDANVTLTLVGRRYL